MNAPLIHKNHLSRRGAVLALLSAAGGLALGMALPRPARADPMGVAIQSPEGGDPHELTAWVVIDPDDTVTLRMPHVEMGQGTSTALAMILAEELECDWAKVRCEYASANRNLREKGIYGPMTTAGSSGVRTSWKVLQQAGASARGRLVEAAARRWNAPASDCAAAQGKVTHAGSGRVASYGALAADAAKISLAAEPAIKTPDQYRLIGKRTARLDTRVKVDGSARFGIDAKVPGMVHAAVSCCPVFGGKLASVDDVKAKAMPGVIAVVRMDDAVAVVADRFWRAKTAVDALSIVWDSGDAAKIDSEQLDKAYRDALDGPLVTARNDGDTKAALAAPGAKVIEALYEAPYLSHAPMEPLNATVHLQPDRVDVWISTQSPPSALATAAKAAGVPPEQVYVHNNFVGGGFGRRTRHDELIQAVTVAKAVGRPVKLIWTREQDILRDRFRPQAATRFRATLGPDGKVGAFESSIAVGSLLRSLGSNPVASGLEPMAVECIATTPYLIPNLHVGVQLKNTHVPVMFWRGVGSSQNGFFIESFIDEMAHAAGQDPYAFRRAMLTRKDWLGVLEVMADKGDWGKPMAPGRGRGMAIGEAYGTVTGQVIEVTVGPKGDLKVDKVTAVVDCYHLANPNTVEQQIEGAVVFGLTAALYGEITIKDGAAHETNFDRYRMMKLADAPKIEIHLPVSGGATWGGIGEPGLTPTAPALCNAIFAATGKRIRRLPIARTDLSQA
jgi:isoquinoline 1-oxidoreductase beta subunit